MKNLHAKLKVYWKCKCVFSTTLDLIWPKFCPSDHTYLVLLCWRFLMFQWHMLARGFNINIGDSVLITLLQSSCSNLLKLLSWGPTCTRWVSMDNTQNEKIFVGRNDKNADNRPSITFFISYIKMFWLILCDVFYDKVKRLMQVKTAMKKWSAWSTPNIKKNIV